MGASPKWKPTWTWTGAASGRGRRCSCSTRSLARGSRQAMPSGTSSDVLPGVQPRKCPSGLSARPACMPAQPGPGSRASRWRVERAASTSNTAWWTTSWLPGRNSIASTKRSRPVGTGTTKLRKTSRPGFRDDVGLGHGHHQLRFTEPPTGCEPRGGRQHRRIAFGRAAVGPTPKCPDRLLGEPAFADEGLRPRLWEPGRHVPGRGHCGDPFGPLPRSGVHLEAEGTDTALAVAGDAVLEEDRGDVPGEGDGFLGGRQAGRYRKCGEE